MTASRLIQTQGYAVNPKVSVYIATSLDGYIARPDGNLDWLDEASACIPEGNSCGYNELMETVDCLVLGRKTFEKVLSFGDWPYGELQVRVLTRHLDVVPDHLASTVAAIQGTPEGVCRMLAAEGFQHLYIDGGETIQAFLEARIVDEMTLTLIPVLLGSGRRLFGDLSADSAWRFESVEHFEFGMVQLKLKPAHQRNATESPTF